MELPELPNCFYRVSIKALVLNEERNKFLIVKEENGKWEFPGGGLDWGMTPHEDLPREIDEEMGLEVTWIEDHPSYFLSDQVSDKKFWFINVFYETKLKDLNFTPSDECIEVKFVDLADIEKLEIPVHSNVYIFAKLFDPNKHA